jgi:4'-phosphopantetheinyl transferase
MLSNQGWSVPPEDIQLADDGVHVWRVSLQVPQTTVQSFRGCLSEEELLKAGRFYFDRDRNRYIVARGLLRTFLGCYLHMEPAQLRFRYNAYGKPELDVSSSQHVLHFNVSHSHELALLAFAYDRPLGVDIEFMRPDIEFEALAKHSFSPNENAVLHALPQNVIPQGFYNCWTRKEAYIKARGMGLSLDLRLFDVSLRPGEPAALLASREDPREVSRWAFQTLHPGPDYAGALAVEGQGWKLSTWQWNED